MSKIDLFLLDFLNNAWKYPNLIKAKPRTQSAEENDFLAPYTSSDIITSLDVFKASFNPFSGLLDYSEIIGDLKELLYLNNCYWKLYLKFRSMENNHAYSFEKTIIAYKNYWSPKHKYKCWHCKKPDCYRYCTPYCINNHPKGECSCTFEEIESYLRKDIIFQ
jgi:hypothetical protein